MPTTEPRIAAVRRFNRFYTRRIGVLGEGMLRSEFSLTEVRVLYELAHRERPTAAELRRELGIDAGYLSRILGKLERRGLVKRAASPTDRRQSVLVLTPSGKKAFAGLDARQQDEVRAMLDGLPDGDQRRAVDAMGTIERAFGEPDARASYLIRDHRPGDLGWVLSRHAAFYTQEYGWNDRFEALVAQIIADFARGYDPRREHCWIAERDGEPVGSIFLVERSKTVSQLRMLLVEPSARGLGIGERLVGECLRFARQVGYRKMVLWTNGILAAARRLYQRAGFQLVKEAAIDDFGPHLTEQTWELTL